MKGIFRRVALCAVVLGLSAQPAHACWNSAEQDAVRISNLNMMLMVSALRCRNGRDNFLDHYNRFVGSNNALLGSQNTVIRNRLAAIVGAHVAINALDKMTIGFANNYGGGHPTMGCAEIRQLASEILSQRQSVSSLAAIADRAVGLPELSGGSCPVSIASRN